MITLYTAIIAACESVLSQDPHNTFFAFRLLVYLVALACTVCVAIRTVTPATNSVRTAASSPEVLAATLAFGASGRWPFRAVSFMYGLITPCCRSPW